MSQPSGATGPETPLHSFALRMPKVELHLHLEGSIEPATLLALSRKNRVSLPADDLEGIRRWFRFDDFPHFLEAYLACCDCLRQPEDFQRLVLDLAAAQERQNVLLSEVHFTVGTHIANGVPGDELADALAAATAEAQRRHGVILRWIPDLVRNVPWKWADRTVEWALDHRDCGVVGLGLAGKEDGHPADPFVDHFAAAAAAGLGTVAHAGEQAGPESVRNTLSCCQPRRLAHGVRAVEDPELVAELAAAHTPCDVCPTSNLLLGVYDDLPSHPFDALRRAGVEVTVGSDDPTFFATSLTAELTLLADTFGYAADDLAALQLAALGHSFLPSDEQEQLRTRMREEIATLGSELLGEGS